MIKGVSKHINIKEDLCLYENVIFELSNESELTIGRSCTLSYGVVISCMVKIQIGNFVQIGEYSSIRDTTHSHLDLKIPMKKQKDVSKEITIGNDVWIGKACLTMPGTIIEDGVIVGANSLIKGRLVKNGIYAGNPVRLIKLREEA